MPPNPTARKEIAKPRPRVAGKVARSARNANAASATADAAKSSETGRKLSEPFTSGETPITPNPAIARP